jgi:hypothetical protein
LSLSWARPIQSTPHSPISSRYILMLSTHLRLGLTIDLFPSRFPPITYARIITSSGILRRVAIVRTDVSEERSASIIRVTTIDELRTRLAVTRNRCMEFFTVTAEKTSNLTTYTESSSPAFAMHAPPTSSFSTWSFSLAKITNHAAPRYAVFLHPPVTSSALGRNIFLSTLFSNIRDPCFSLNARDQVSHPYRNTGKIIVIYVPIVKFFERGRHNVHPFISFMAFKLDIHWPVRLLLMKVFCVTTQRNFLRWFRTLRSWRQ